MSLIIFSLSSLSLYIARHRFHRPGLRPQPSGLPTAVAHPGLHCCLSLGICAIARVFAPAALRLPRSLPVDFATLHTAGCLRQSFSLRSIISPFGLPSAGYPASARWHVFSANAPVASFAPAHLALRAACGRLPSQRPLARVQVSSLRFPVSPFTF